MESAVSGTRGVGEFVFVDVLPEPVLVAFAAITHLGDPWFLYGLLAAVYWFADERFAENPRRAGATAIALLTCTHAAVAVGKATTALPRPPRSDPTLVMEAPAWLPAVLGGWYSTQLVSSGFGFPSGHAAGGVVAYGALALLLTRPWTRTYRVAFAGFLAIAIAFSRVAIGVHYLVDVVVGAALGVVILWVGLRLAADRRLRFVSNKNGLEPNAIFLLAAGLSTIGVWVASSGGFTDDVVEAGIGLSAGIGGAIGWSLVSGDEPAVPTRVALVGTVVAAGVWIAALSFEVRAVAWSVTPSVAVVSTAVGVVLVLALPSLATRATR